LPHLYFTAMLKEIDTVKLIFGLKVAQLRRDKGLSYQQLSDLTGMAISYLHNIEKGKKYPKADKIMLLARALDSNYNYLVSLDADKKLKPIIDLLNSAFLKVFPLSRFGIDVTKLIELLSATPDKVNAFISTVVKVTRNYQVQGEDFYKAALRSFQDLHDNYFPELEQAVREFRQTFGYERDQLIRNQELEVFLQQQYDIRVDRSWLNQHPVLQQVRSYFVPGSRTLYINSHFSPAQENMLLAKEIAYQYLQIEDRPYETRMVEIRSFDHLLNNFKASYFGVALLMGEANMVEDIRAIAAQERYSDRFLLDLMHKYEVTEEMLLQRLTNILPHHFSIHDLFFLRFYRQPNSRKFDMTKEMHLSQLHNPYANQLEEHFCRRWVSIDIIEQFQQLPEEEQMGKTIGSAQISRYVGSDNAYLCMSLAKNSSDAPEHATSVTIGLLINDELRRLFRWLDDPALSNRLVHTTCERCPIQQCEERVAAPAVLQHINKRKRIKQVLRELRNAGEPALSTERSVRS